MLISQKATKATPALLHIQERQALTSPHAEHQTFHIVLSGDRTHLPFKPGDSLGIFAQNDPILVTHLLEAMQAKGDEPILCPRSQETLKLRDFLTHKANLSRVTSSFLKLFYTHVGAEQKKEQLSFLLNRDNHDTLLAYLKNSDPLDLFREYGEQKIPLHEICSQFGPLLPRFYSIASSSHLFPEQIDLTVALSSFTHGGALRYGVASHFLCHLAIPFETKVPAYVQHAPHFGLPEEDTTSIIMVGPGTGVAPFRAFLQERIFRKAKGKHWLFFGERYRKQSYFYESFFEELAAQGTLKLSLAFSRDQPEKYYVQHAMRHEGKALFAEIEQGAYFYVCGDADPMAKEVEATLSVIIEEEGKCSSFAAREYIKEMRRAKRYLTDVY